MRPHARSATGPLLSTLQVTSTADVASRLDPEALPSRLPNPFPWWWVIFHCGVKVSGEEPRLVPSETVQMARWCCVKSLETGALPRKVIPTTPRASRERVKIVERILVPILDNLRPRFGVPGSNHGVHFMDDIGGLKFTVEIWNMRRSMDGIRMTFFAAACGVMKWYIVPQTQLHGCSIKTP